MLVRRRLVGASIIMEDLHHARDTAIRTRPNPATGRRTPSTTATVSTSNYELSKTHKERGRYVRCGGLSENTVVAQNEIHRAVHDTDVVFEQGHRIRDCSAERSREALRPDARNTEKTKHRTEQ